MRFLATVLLACSCWFQSFGQTYTDAASPSDDKREQFFSFNPLALAEPQMAIGAGFGHRLTRRSEYFSELSILADNPFYKNIDNNLHGFRAIAQYRYHFLHSWRLLSGLLLRGLPDQDSYMAVEFRLKNYTFTGTENFVHEQTNNTLPGYLYNARATVFGGAILLGTVYDLSSSGKLQLEVSSGIGVKQKVVKFKNLPAGYRVSETEVADWGFVPKIYEAVGTVYLPFAIRFRYRIS